MILNIYNKKHEKLKSILKKIINFLIFLLLDKRVQVSKFQKKIKFLILKCLKKKF